MAVSNAMTADFLRSAYGGESMAHMRYIFYGGLRKKKDIPIRRSCLRPYPTLKAFTPITTSASLADRPATRR